MRFGDVHELGNLEMIRMWDKNVKVGSGHVFVVLGAHVRVFNPLNDYHSNAHFA